MNVSTGALMDGTIWQLNRPIDITLDRAVDFLSVNFGSVVVRTTQGLDEATGTYSRGVEPATGAPDLNVVRFQPSCPTSPSTAPGLLPGTEYELIIFRRARSVRVLAGGYVLDASEQRDPVEFIVMAGHSIDVR